MEHDLHATITNVVDHIFSLRDQLLLDSDETVELLREARGCTTIDEVLNLHIADPENYLVRRG